jgi:hypothetical protein
MLQKIKLKSTSIPSLNYFTVRKLNFLTFIINSMNKYKVFKGYGKVKNYKIIKNYFLYTYISFFLRIVWRGKAYRIRLFKKKKKFTFNFGHSHWYKLVYNKPFYSFFRIKRQSYLVLFNTRNQRRTLTDIFSSIRPYNKYTRRGIRLKKSVYIRRFGKISQVNSILHSF